nr:hypothetical protein GCM10020063_017030 [Dactylosporangium thailandense]
MPKQRTWPRYGLTRAQIDTCTRLRAAGDWAGACAAAGITAEVDPARVAREHGAEAAAALDDDLRHLVPDLLRWHLLGLRRHPVRHLAAYGRHIDATEGVIPLTFTPRRRLLRRRDDGHGLYVVPYAAGRTRYALRYGPLEPHHLLLGLHGLRELWDERDTAGLLARCGGHTRLPGFAPDGTRLVGDGPEAVAERALTHLRAGRGEAAWREAGYELDVSAAPAGWPEALASPGVPAAPGLALRVWRTAATAGVGAVDVGTGRRHRLRFEGLDPTGRERPRLRVLEDTWRPDIPPTELPLTELFPVADVLDLLDGRTAPADLHPLVAASLFPALAGPAGPAPARLDEVYRVRCGPDWHELTFAGGVLRFPHPPELIDRELALLALGGPLPAGCAGAVIAWRGGPSRLPVRLRDLRGELYDRAQLGEADSVTALLDAGLDPHVPAGDGRTLLHVLADLVPDEAALRLLDRLLAAGLDPAARTADGVTPLRYAQRVNAAPALVAALHRAS